MSKAFDNIAAYLDDMAKNGSRPAGDQEMACLRGMWPDSKFYTFGDLRALVAECDTMRNLIADLQWQGGYDSHERALCPRCQCTQYQGHLADCEIGKIVKLPEPVPVETVKFDGINYTRWDGGENPVPGKKVNIICRGEGKIGRMDVGFDASESVRWTHDGSGGDIIAYKVLE